MFETKYGFLFHQQWRGPVFFTCSHSFGRRIFRMGKPSAAPEGKGIGLPSGNARLWHESIPNVEGASERKRKKNAPKEETVQQLQNKAKAALEREVVLLDSDKGRKGKSSNNDAGFLRKIMASGTLSDKMVSTAPWALSRRKYVGVMDAGLGSASFKMRGS
jgi:hypothetical protein